jgi:hypothetical protein
VAVDLVATGLPERTGDLTPLDSPLQAHARRLKRDLGAGIAVVFLGPCIGKKREVAAAPGLLAAALTFEELRGWLYRAGIDPEAQEASEADAFVPEEAREGALYPVEGGMSEATRLNMRTGATRFMTLCCVENIRRGLKDLPDPGAGNLFLEVLACEGGCVCGPKAAPSSAVTARMRVLDAARLEAAAGPRTTTLPLFRTFAPRPLACASPAAERLAETLRQIGKQGPEDELNCGGCGYDTCRDLAGAILGGRAEARMCVSHLRRLAEKKANALFRTLPMGVVIVDQSLTIIESNEEFASIMGEDALLAQEAQPGLAGAHLEKFLPFADRFREVLASGEDIIREKAPLGDRTLSATVFTVEPHRVVGALLLDVTTTEDRHQQIIRKAETVIQNMLGNVQEIAFSLGRNAARSEGILNEIIAEFAGTGREDAHGPRP